MNTTDKLMTVFSWMYIRPMMYTTQSYCDLFTAVIYFLKVCMCNKIDQFFLSYHCNFDFVLDYVCAYTCLKFSYHKLLQKLSEISLQYKDQWIEITNALLEMFYMMLFIFILQGINKLR